MTTILDDFINYLKTLIRYLYLSVTSYNFYDDLINNFKGYGLKYLFQLNFIIMTIILTVIFNQYCSLSGYFSNGIVNSNISRLADNIINNWPTLEYDGKKFKLKDEESFVIYNSNNKPFITFDTENKLANKHKIDSFIVITDTKILVSHTPLQNFLGPDSLTIDRQYILNLFKEHYSKYLRLYIYFVFPSLILLHFIYILLQKSFIVLFIYFAAKYLLNYHIKFQTIVRLILFASGVPTIIQPLTMFIPELVWLVMIVELWTNYLCINSLIKNRNRIR